jgi:hypothetical protein
MPGTSSAFSGAMEPAHLAFIELESYAMDPEPSELPTEVDAYTCENCFRRCVWAREPGKTGEPRCLCGAVLEPADLAPGVYEIVDHTAVESAKPPRVEPAPRIRQEADVGYGKSHGYGPGHGGPTGPGDAPAGETDTPHDD